MPTKLLESGRWQMVKGWNFLVSTLVDLEIVADDKVLMLIPEDWSSFLPLLAEKRVF